MRDISDRVWLTAKARLFRGFSDPSRLSIVEALADGPKNVGQIVQLTGLTQPNVSSHLNCLHGCGLVSAQPSGKYVIYALSASKVNELLTQADQLLADVARGVYECTRYEPTEDAFAAVEEQE